MPDLGIRLQGSGTFEGFDAFEYQGTISVLITVHFFNTMQISTFSLIDNLFRIFFLCVAEHHCLQRKASAFADQLLICGLVISVQVEEQSSQEQRSWVEHFFLEKEFLQSGGAPIAKLLLCY